MKVLITGSAGFIGFHLAKRLLRENVHVIGIDNLNSYYEISLKEARLKQLKEINLINDTKFEFFKEDINSPSVLDDIFKKMDTKPSDFLNTFDKTIAMVSKKYKVPEKELIGYFEKEMLTI